MTEEASKVSDRLPIYLDHQATTPIDPRVVAVMVDALTGLFGNPNSIQHKVGRDAARAIASAREDVAALVGAEPDHVHFTSGASDAIGQAFAAALRRKRPRQIAVMPVEHPAMLRTIKALAASGDVVVHPLDVDHHAQLRIESLYAALDAGVDLVCLMMANNEVGTIYPVTEVAQTCVARGVELMVDATQASGRLPLETLGSSVDYLIISSHKIYGPKGVGALVTPHRSAVSEAGSHSGTPNAPTIVGFGAAARLALASRAEEWRHTAALRDRLQAGLVAALPDVIVNGDTTARLPHSLHISVPGALNDAIVARIGHRIAISTGAACASGALEPSHVLLAMALPQPLIDGALRLSTGRFTTEAEVDEAITEIVAATRAVRGAHAKGMPT
jgi:cysteine desulfurase